MRVGIDACLLSKSVTGIGRYTAELTSELVKKTGDFHLYSAGSVSVGQWQQNNVIVRSNNFHRRLPRKLWLQTYLSFWATKDHLDVFWGPTHRLPHFLPERTARVVTIHDMVWKHAGSTMRPLSRLMEAILMPQAIESSDLVVTVSKSTARDLSEAYPKASNKIRVIYPGCTPLPEPGENSILADLNTSLLYILFVGTLEPRKNLNRLMRAFASLGERCFLSHCWWQGLG